MRKWWGLALCAFFVLLSGFFLVQWRTAALQSDALAEELTSTQQQLDTLQRELEDADARRRALALENDPIAPFFQALPYSGAAAGYLSDLEYNAYRGEMLHAAEQIKAHIPEDEKELVDAYTAFIDDQAQAAAGMWSEHLSKTGASTASAWSHTSSCKIPIYREGAYCLISLRQRMEEAGSAYEFLFSPEDTRQTLLDGGMAPDVFE